MRGKPRGWRDPAEGECVPTLDQNNGTSEEQVDTLGLVQQFSLTLCLAAGASGASGADSASLWVWCGRE